MQSCFSGRITYGGKTGTAQIATLLAHLKRKDSSELVLFPDVRVTLRFKGRKRYSVSTREPTG